MGKELNKEYYDEVFRTSQEYSIAKKAENSTLFSVFNYVVNILNKEETILEMGCGTGQLAEKLIKEGYNYVLGIDFSHQGIAMCKQRCGVDKFLCSDLHDFDFKSIKYSTVIATETFEHIANDKGIIKKIPKGTRVILSLPSYDSKGHVRYFKNAEAIINYYKGLLNNINIAKSNRHFIVDSVI